MIPATPPAVTLLVAAALGLILLWLSLRVVQARYARRVASGTGGDPLIEARVRAHANFTEYAPLALVLMALIEMRGASPTGLWALGAALVVARLLHPFGMERPAPNALRAVGILLTWLVLLALVVWAAAIGLAPHPAVTYLN